MGGCRIKHNIVPLVALSCKLMLDIFSARLLIKIGKSEEKGNMYEQHVCFVAL